MAILRYGHLACKGCHSSYASRQRDHNGRKRLAAGKLRLSLGGLPSLTEAALRMSCRESGISPGRLSEQRNPRQLEKLSRRPSRLLVMRNRGGIPCNKACIG
jgi:hypothetical protein